MNTFSRSQILFALGIAVLIPALVIALLSFIPQARQSSQRASSTIMAVPLRNDWQMTDHNGERVSAASYPGKYLLIFFGFTYCPDVCPFELHNISKALKIIDQQTRDKLQTLFVSLDPARDTPDVLKTYLELFKADIIGLSGTADETHDMANDFKVYFQKTDDGPDYLINHSAYTYLVSPQGQLADIYASDTEAAVLATKLKNTVK